MVNEAGDCCDDDGNCCPPEKPLIDSQGRCQACQGTLVLKNKNDCDKCSETHQLHYQWASYRCFPKCPDGQVMATDGKCHGCNDAPFEIGQKSAEDGFIDLCESICPNRQITQTQRSGGYPYVCAIKCTEPDTFMDGYGNCQPCSSEDVIKASETECHTCGNRVLEWGDWCHRCDLVEGDLGTNQSWCLQCPNLIARYGGCSLCDSPAEDIWLDWNPSQSILNSCLQCRGVRYLSGGHCIRCPEDLSTLTPEQQAQCGG